ncbi:zinc ribbon domain-containing protein [Halobaculum lipolyticum]|uniref:Zinc ribbon domain-containing protein n=1 Tax=Halobaculum lipolyticum TaxID=3032001 RepID=A0ABD5W5L9_9EURY|nr:zinc ribbon domain-containing protein [Halobaculum sp. DT31]
MTDAPTVRRPLIAAVFGAILPGSGHLYLRLWKRAAAWLLLAAAVSVATLPADPLGGPATASDVLGVLAGAAVAAVSAVDAYRLARSDAAATPTAASAVGSPVVDCPACGRPLDPELRFCSWCTTEFERFRVTGERDG